MEAITKTVDTTTAAVLKHSTAGVGRAMFIKAAKPKPAPTEPGSKAADNPTGETQSVGIIDPPYDLTALTKFRESSNCMVPMIDAYKTNIAGFGYKLKYNIDMQSKDIDQGMKDQAKKDWVRLDNFYKYCNFDKTFEEILQMMIDDKEYIGFGVLEVLTNPKGEPAGFEYIPAHTINISQLDPNPQIVKLESVGADGKKVTMAFQKKFRKFRQKIDTDNTTIWFKEFGDPRIMDKTTGEFIDPTNKSQQFDPNNAASGLIMFSNSVPYTVYGLPRWIGNIMGMQGSRKAEELNYRYFTNGRHTPMAIIVKNGSLTTSSGEVLKSYVDNLEGVDNAFGYLVLEGIGYEDEAADGTPAPVDIEVKNLTDTLQTDALFQNYDKENIDKLREAFRLAPIYTGASKDYTRATADVARAITEEQVFQPERKRISGRINRLVNQSLGIKYVDMHLNGPDVTNKKDLADAVSIYTRTGAITPNIVMQAVSDLLGQEFEPIQDSWGDLPLTIVLELIKQGKLDINGVKDAPGTDPSFTDDQTPADDTTTTTETTTAEGDDQSKKEDNE